MRSINVNLSWIENKLIENIPYDIKEFLLDIYNKGRDEDNYAVEIILYT
jgi:hypothetical protein